MKNKKNLESVDIEETDKEMNTNAVLTENQAETVALTKEQKRKERAVLKAAKKKRKQEKKAKIEPDEFVKNLQINKKQYFATYLTFLISACSILLIMVITMMVLIPVWWVQLIDLAVLGFCIWRCVHLCLRVNKQEIYSLYANCLIVQSIMVDTIVPLKDVYSATPYSSWIDKLRKKGPHCIRLNLSQKHKNYVVIGYIEEDLQPICDQILLNAKACRENENAKAEQALKELQEELEKVRKGEI